LDDFSSGGGGKEVKAVEIARKAASLIGGDRAKTHGDMHQHFASVALLWNAYMMARRDAAAPLAAADVPHMMALLKIARTQSGAPNPDDFVDAAGYLSCAGEVALARPD